MIRTALQHGRFTQARRAGTLAFLGILVACLTTGAQTPRSIPASGSTAGKEVSPAKVPTASIPKVPEIVLDRVVAIVNDDLILDSDVDEERRFAAFEPYGDAAAAFSRTKAIEQLINRDLILQQIKLQPEDQISDDDVNKQIEALRKAIPACKQYNCETKQGWDKFLADQGFTETLLFSRWKQRMEMLQFIEERFRMGIRITPDQIKNYYEKTLLPKYAQRHVTPPNIAKISDQIQEVLLQQQVTDLLNEWLKSLRAQGSVVVLHPGEEAP